MTKLIMPEVRVSQSSPELLELARKTVAAIEARTAPYGSQCPCGRGIAGARGGLGRFHCVACEEEALAAAVRFVMDDSFGGP